jgi:CHAT domain-containing protein/Tfp pilus assembly protein PilF
LTLFAGLLIPAVARGQEVPKVTKEGKQAVEKLVLACRDDGGLKIVRRPDGTEALQADEAKLRATVAGHPELLTPALRDALVASWFGSDIDQKRLFEVWVRAYGEQKKDERALGFAALFAAVAERADKPAVAVRDYQESVRHFGAAGDTAWQAVCLNDIGLTYHHLADFANALKYLQQGLELWRKVHDGPHAGTANTLENIGLAYHDFGDYVRALDYHNQALTMRRKLHDGPDPDVALSLSNIGAVYHALGDYAKALEFDQQALAMLRKVYDKPHADLAMTLDNIGSAYAALEDRANALDYLKQGLAMRRKLHDGPDRDIAQSLNNIGTAYHAFDEPDKALDFLRQALAMKRKLYDRPHPDVALTLHNLGSAQSDLGDYAGALDSYQQALAVWRKLYTGPHPDVAASLNNIAVTHRDLGQSAKALERLDEALKEVRLPGGEESVAFEKLQPGQLRPLGVTVAILADRGQTLEATLPDKPAPARLRECEHCYALGADVLDRVRQESLVHETSKLFAGATQASLTPRRVGLCRRLYELEGNPEYLRTAFQAAEQGRARVFLEELGTSRAGLLGGVSPELRAREAELLHRLREHDLRIENEQNNPGKGDTPLAKLWEGRKQTEAELLKLVAQLEKEYPRYAGLKYPKPCTIEEARASLGPNEVALHFVLGDQESYALLLEAKPAPHDKANGLAIYSLPGRDAIAGQASALVETDTLERPAHLRSLGTDLYAKLLAPLADRLRDKGLVIVPDGPLGYLAFELLVEPADGGGRFLVEGHRIRYAPSLTALHLSRLWAAQREHQPDRLLWALGDPDYGTGDEGPTAKRGRDSASRDAARELAWREGQGTERFPRLRFSKDEVEQIRDRLGESAASVLLGKDATEAAVRQASADGALDRARYVHFACHGVLGLHDGQPPALVLSLVGNSGQRDEYGVLDGFLRLDEVTNLRLNADLVVLSACRSGQGRLYNGEGVHGLARAFLHAGSKGVVCSLWSVDDRETADLMTDMYTRLKRGDLPPDALRQAQLAMLRAGKPPIFWAPFIYIGDRDTR